METPTDAARETPSAPGPQPALGVIRSDGTAVVDPVGDWLDYDEAAAYSKLSKSNVQKRVAAGQLPACHVGRRVIIARADLDRYIASHRVAS